MATAKEIRSLFRRRRAPVASMLPDSDLPCAIRLLSDGEIDRIREQAMRWLDDRCKSERLDLNRVMLVDPDLYEREKTRRIVFAAFVDPATGADDDEPKPLFPSVDAVRELDAAYVSELMACYLDVQDLRTQRSPLSDGALADVMRLLEDAEGDAVLATFDDLGLRRLVRALAERLRRPS